MAVFSRIGYIRTEARSRLFDVMWAHDYPFGGDLKEMLQSLDPHQKVRMHLPYYPTLLLTACPRKLTNIYTYIYVCFINLSCKFAE